MNNLRKIFAIALSACLLGACAPAEDVSDEVSPPTVGVGARPAQSDPPGTVAPPTAVQTPTTDRKALDNSTTAQQDVSWEEGEVEAALTTVASFYEALNKGEVELASQLLVDKTDSARLSQSLRLAVEGLNAQFRYQCTPGSTGGSVVCDEYVTDDLYGPAGITNAATVTYSYHHGRLTTSGWHRSFVCEADPTGAARDFLMEFRVWSAQSYPELERHWLWGEPVSSVAAIPCTVYPFIHPESAIEIRQIVPEFVEQSDHWPIDSEADATPERAGQYIEGVTRVVEIPGGLTRKFFGNQSTSLVFRGAEPVFSLTHDSGKERAMAREPEGALSAEGWQGGVWEVSEGRQTEINRMWPPHSARGMDVLWLTDYTGMTADTLTGFTPDRGNEFTLYGYLILEPIGVNRGLYGLHADCRSEGDQIAAALYSFEGARPVPLIGWVVDPVTMTLVEMEDPEVLELGGCLRLEPRPMG